VKQAVWVRHISRLDLHLRISTSLERSIPASMRSNEDQGGYRLENGRLGVSVDSVGIAVESNLSAISQLHIVKPGRYTADEFD